MKQIFLYTTNYTPQQILSTDDDAWVFEPRSLHLDEFNNNFKSNPFNQQNVTIGNQDVRNGMMEVLSLQTDQCQVYINTQDLIIIEGIFFHLTQMPVKNHVIMVIKGTINEQQALDWAKDIDTRYQIKSGLDYWTLEY